MMMNELIQGIGPLTAILGVMIAYSRLKRMQQDEQTLMVKKCQEYTDKEVAHLKEIYNNEVKNLEHKIDQLRDEIKNYNKQTNELLMKALDRGDR